MKGLDGKTKNIISSVPSTTLPLYDQCLNSPGKEHILRPPVNALYRLFYPMLNIHVYILMIKFNS